MHIVAYYVDLSPTIHRICYFTVSLKFAHFEGFFNNHEEYGKAIHLLGTCASFKVISEMFQEIEDCLRENDEVT